MPPPAGVGVDDVAEHVELVWCYLPIWNSDPDHLVGAALTLSVDAVVQTEHSKHVFLDRAVEKAVEHPFELRDVVGHVRIFDVGDRPNCGRWLGFKGGHGRVSIGLIKLVSFRTSTPVVCCWEDPAIPGSKAATSPMTRTAGERVASSPS